MPCTCDRKKALSSTMIKDVKEYIEMRMRSIQLAETKGSDSLLQLENKIDDFVSSAWDIECTCDCSLCARCCVKANPTDSENLPFLAIPVPRPVSYTVPDGTGTVSVANSVLGGTAGWGCIGSDTSNALSVCLVGSDAGYSQSLASAYDLWAHVFSNKASFSSTIYLYLTSIFILNKSSETQTIVSTNTDLTTDGGAISIVAYQDNDHIGSNATVVACDPAGSAPASGIAIDPGQVCELRVQFLSCPTSTSGTTVLAKVFGIITPSLA